MKYQDKKPYERNGSACVWAHNNAKFLDETY